MKLEPAPKLVLFDLDDTLCDHDGSLNIRLNHSFAQTFPDHLKRQQVVSRSAEIAWEGTDHFEDLLAEFGIHDRSAADSARDRYVSDRFRGLELFADTLPVIQRVRESYSIGIITNGPTDIQQPKLDLLQIEPLFSFVLISESVGIWKPDPGIFHLALEMGEARPEEAIYIGDSVSADVPGAHAAGMRAIWMNRKGVEWTGDKAPHLEIRDLNELLTALDLDG